MEDGLSAVIPNSLDFADFHNREDEDSADEGDRLKELNENLENTFADMSEQMTDDDDDDSRSSVDDSVDHSHDSNETSGDSHSKAAYEKPYLQPNESSKSSSSSHHESSHLDKQSSFINEDSLHSSVDHSSSYNAIAKQQNFENSLHVTTNSFLENELNFTSNRDANYNMESKSIDLPSNSYDMHGTNNDISSKYQDRNESPSRFSGKLDTEAYSSQFNSQPTALQKEFIKLQALYNHQCKELERIKMEEKQAKEVSDKTIKNLTLKLALAEGEKDRLTSALQKSQEQIADFRQENNILKGNLNALEVRLSAEKEAKESALGKLESCEITIQSLEKQIKDITRSENAARLQTQSDSIMKELKLRHQKEILQLKDEIDKLQKNLNYKIQVSNDMSSQVVKLQERCEKLTLEKTEMFNQLSANLEVSQKQCQKLLESGTIQEISILKLKVQHLQEEKSKLEKQNTDLKDELKTLESELKTSETLQKLTSGNENEDLQSSQSNKKSQSPKDSSVKQDLKRSLKSIHTLRQTNNSLKEKLSELNNQLPLWEEKAKLFESRFNESEKKAKELEKRLEDVLPGGSIPMDQHEKELSKLKSELADIQKKYKDITGRFKALASSEKKLFENNKNLQSQIAEMYEKHTTDKFKAIEECRKNCLELHESTLKKLNDELTSKYDKEIKTVCSNYENKIAEFQRQIKQLNEGLYEAKAQYVNIFKENEALQSKLDSISHPKEWQEFENELRSKYEKKLTEMKEIQKQTMDQFEASVKREAQKLQKEWTIENMHEIEDFINNTKQKLDEKFIKCLEIEQNKFHVELEAEKKKMMEDYEKQMKDLKKETDAEKEKISQDYEQKINALKRKSDAERQKLIQDFEEDINVLKQQLNEKESMSTKLRESFQLKWKSEIKDLQQNHQSEIKSITQKYDDTILSLQKEIKYLKENLFRTSEDNQEVQKLQKEFSTQRETWEKEKSDLIHSKCAVEEQLKSALHEERRLREKVKKYQRYVPSLEKKLQDEINRLRTQKDELQKSKLDKEDQLFNLNEQYRKEIDSLKHRKKQPALRNVESQTEEPVVLRKTLQNTQEMFIQCLRKIFDEMKTYLLNYRKRSAEYLQKALYHYHDQLTSKIFQDVFKESSFNPHINMNSHASVLHKENVISPNTMQQQYRAKLSNSTPIDKLASGRTDVRLGSYQSEEINSKVLHNQKSSTDSGFRTEDISFDFEPMRMLNSAFMSTKMPVYTERGGLFRNSASTLSSFPQRPSPISSVK